MKKIKVYPKYPKYRDYIPSWWPLSDPQLKSYLLFIGKSLWKIFGNSDDPEPRFKFYRDFPFKSKFWTYLLILFGDRINLIRFHWLFIRNPLHNFMFYVIGLRNKERIMIGIDPISYFLEGKFNIILHVWKIFIFPYISYMKTFKNKIFEFYIGWRPNGALGFKCRLKSKK